MPAKKKTREDYLAMLREGARIKREYRDAEGGAIEVARVDAPMQAVCGWCDGPVGSSGECERGCARVRQERRG